MSEELYIIQNHEPYDDPLDWGPLLCEGHHKIGISNDPERRISRLRGGTPNKLRITARVDVPDDPKLAEECLHKLMSAYHVRREWFSLPTNVIITFRKLESVRAETLERMADSPFRYSPHDGMDLFTEIRRYG